MTSKLTVSEFAKRSKKSTYAIYALIRRGCVVRPNGSLGVTENDNGKKMLFGDAEIKRGNWGGARKGAGRKRKK